MNTIHDELYDFVLTTLIALHNMDLLDDSLVLGRTLEKIDAHLREHYLASSDSALSTKLPNIGAFFTELPFKEAFLIYNRKYNVTRRRHVPPSCSEIRHVFNIAQGIALTDKLKLLTFDGDETLYPDGENFNDCEMAKYIVQLIKRGVNIGIITAAGYGYEVERYEQRVRVLLEYFKDCDFEEASNAFFVMGGESNYLLRCNKQFGLEAVPCDEWQTCDSKDEDIERLLGVAEKALLGLIEELGLRASIIKKERAVGLIPGGDEGKLRVPIGSGGGSLKFEILEEAVQRIRHSIRNAGCTIPYCAFNGGRDMWVDIGNKAEGLKALQAFLGIRPEECAHIGDQFTETGNDIAARNASPTFWITNPMETKAVMRSLLRQMGVKPDCDLGGRVEQDPPPASEAMRFKLSHKDSWIAPAPSWRIEEQEWVDTPPVATPALAASPVPTGQSRAEPTGEASDCTDKIADPFKL